MDPQLVSIAQNCLDAAYDKTMSFPDIVQTLIKSGFDGYSVDYRLNTTAYFLSDGGHAVLENRSTPGPVAPKFDAAGIAAQIKWAQSNAPDYSYAAFCHNVKALGCAGYLVSFSGRRVLYFGRTAETHVEHFPNL